MSTAHNKSAKWRNMGVAPTGKELAISGTVIDRFVDGKVVEAWKTVDTLGLMRQLGATAPFE